MDQQQVFAVGSFRVIRIKSPIGAELFWIPGVGSFVSLPVAIGIAMSLAFASGEVLSSWQVRDLNWFLYRARERVAEEDLIDQWGYSTRIEEGNTWLPSIEFCAPYELISALLHCLRRCENETLSAQEDAFLDEYLGAVKQAHVRWAASQAVVLIPIVQTPAVKPPGGYGK